MNFPLAIPEISLWLAVTAIILLITSEAIPSVFAAKIPLNRFLLRILAIGCGLGFMFTVIMRFAGLA
ncbi:MAG: hypothetical protein LBQ98_00775 [Nitrososphaerota archaeon]|jgi:hypothetical protein|nr:hypothetical protein [Nitrososphaerota archaeon]